MPHPQQRFSLLIKATADLVPQRKFDALSTTTAPLLSSQTGVKCLSKGN